MNKPFVALVIASLALGAGIGAGCSTVSGERAEYSSTGPTVLNPRSNPASVKLNRDMKTGQTVEILAEVKDFQGKVVEVTANFVEVPMRVRLYHVSGSTWRGELSPKQIQALAVGKQTTKYTMNIIARDSLGKTGQSGSPLTVAISAPDLSQSTG